MVGGFVPVVVSSTEGAERAKLLPPPRDIDPSAPGRIEIALADGSRVTVDRDVDATDLTVFGREKWRISVLCLSGTACSADPPP